ncbi:MAG TPA: hypothetical protein PK178_11990 [Smithellaceae bacterium]|nr:hypothetical protein [Smithellaceae bacterium]
MKSKLDTLAVTTASGVAGGAVAYGAAVKSLGFLSFGLWKLGVPMIAIFSGPVIIGAAAATAVVGGGVYCIAKGIVSQRAKQEQVD